MGRATMDIDLLVDGSLENQAESRKPWKSFPTKPCANWERNDLQLSCRARL